MKLPDESDWMPSRNKALLRVCRKRWRMLDLAEGSPTPPMRINSACALFEGKLYLFGGLNAGPSKSLWALSLHDRRWCLIPAQNGAPPAPRQGHTLCWDGASSLWVFGGQGMATSSSDSSRIHQGVKIRTLTKRTCFNDFHEFDTRTNEWRDHVQAGVSPSSRRGHTATLVINRRGIKPERSHAPKPVARRQGRAGGAGSSQGNKANSPPRSRNLFLEDDAFNSPSHGETARGPSPMRGDFDRGRDGVKSKARGRSKDRKCIEAKGKVSREMLIIGGAGTEPTKLWIFDFDVGSWTCLGTGSNGDGGNCAGPGAPAVFDHTATLVGNNGHIVVVGGITVGQALNSQVFMLALDTLQWSTLIPHPLSLSAPAIHGHTAVEDPANGDRIIVFGGRGGAQWKMEVMTFNYKLCLWSMAVCETAPLPPLSSSSRNIVVKDHDEGVGPLRGNTDQPAKINQSAEGITDVCSVREEHTQRPHQRSGHICFVWDPRKSFVGAGVPSPNTPNPAITRDKPKRNERGEASNEGDNITSTDGFRVGSEQRDSVLPRQEGYDDTSLPNPCIIAFGGSALRVGGGYAEATLYVLEDHSETPEQNSTDEDDEYQEWMEQRAEGSSYEGVSGALEPSTRRRKPIKMFQTCANSVFLELQSLRQLRNRPPTINHQNYIEDLSYVENKIRSVILGDETVSILGKADGSVNRPHSVALSIDGGKATMLPEKGRLGVFPTGYEQVKAFLTDARPVDPNHRPASAPVHSDNVVGGCDGFSDSNMDQGVPQAGFVMKTRLSTAAGARLTEAGDQCCHTLPMMRSRQRSSTRTLNTFSTRSAATAPFTLGVDSEVSSIRAGTGGSSTSGGVGIDSSFARNSDSAVFSEIPAPSIRAIRTRFGQHGRPLLLPKPTLAAHNGRLLLGHRWTGRGMYSSVAGTT